MFIKKKKRRFSLICSFYRGLVKGGLALKVTYQFAIQEVVAYKLVAYKPTPTPHRKPLCQAIYLPLSQTNSPHLHWHDLLNYIFSKSLTNKNSVALELGSIRGWDFWESVVLALTVDGEEVGRIWELKVSKSKNIGWFDMNYPLIIIIIIIFIPIIIIIITLLLYLFV